MPRQHSPEAWRIDSQAQVAMYCAQHCHSAKLLMAECKAGRIVSGAVSVPRFLAG